MAGVLLAATGAGVQAVGLGADGIGPLAIRRAGHPARAFFDGSRGWVTGTFVAGSILFGLGQIVLVIGINQTALLSTVTGVAILIAAVLFSASTAIPSGYGLYVVASLAVVLYAPIVHAVWTYGQR